jgi:hypothetical protein
VTCRMTHAAYGRHHQNTLGRVHELSLLFVDNMRVGTVGAFYADAQPLGLEAGHHHIEIRAAGYQAMSFDVDIMAGQVIPYQGSLER